MDDMTNSWTTVSRRSGLAVGLACLFFWACASGGGSPSAETSATASPSEGPRIETARLERVRVIEAETGARLELEGNAPLVWTQYRDPDGRLVVELPNTLPAPELVDPEPVGIVEQIEIEAVEAEERPQTRITVETRSETEHELGSEGKTLILTLVPVEGSVEDETALAYEPIVDRQDEREAVEEEELAEHAPRTEVEEPVALEAPLGTPENPYRGPEPTGVVASRMDDVEVTFRDGEPVVLIRGDGDFRYSSFQLEDPIRFVVDLHGVTNLAPAASIPADAGALERVRVAQFQSRPESISRVVLDLEEPRFPVLEPTGQGLVIRLQEDGPAVAEEASPEPSPTPEPESVVAEEPEIEVTPDERVEREQTAEPVEEVTIVEEEAEIEGAEEQTEPMADLEPAPASPAPSPAPPPSPVDEPEPSDVSLFEAQEIDQAVEIAVEEDEEQRRFEAQDVTGADREYVGEPINFSLRDADIKEVLRTFAKISGLNMVVQPGVSGSVTVELEQVPWDQALDIILKINDLDYELEGNIMRIAPREVLAREAQQEAERRQARERAVPLKTVLKRVSYSDAASVAGLLQSGEARILSDRGSVVVDPRTNTLIIKELPEIMDTVLSVIDQVDVPEPQVMIEARIVETTKDFSRSLGIDWGITGVADPAHGNTTDLQFPNNVEVEGGVAALTGGNTGFMDLTLGNVLNTFVLDARLQAAESEGLVNVLSAPRVSTLNNATAEIQSGLQIPIQTVSNNTVTVQFVNATLRLNVTPHVTAEGTVLMDIDVQKREPQLAFAVAGATNAPIATRQARTRVIVRDGGTAVIGGIYEVTTNTGQDRVPGLANVPILGHLFKNRRESHNNDELLIFITPRVIKL